MEGVRLTLSGQSSTFSEMSLDTPANSNSHSERMLGGFRIRNPQAKPGKTADKWSARRTTAFVVLSSALLWALIILGVTLCLGEDR